MDLMNVTLTSLRINLKKFIKRFSMKWNGDWYVQYISSIWNLPESRMGFLSNHHSYSYSVWFKFAKIFDKTFWQDHYNTEVNILCPKLASELRKYPPIHLKKNLNFWSSRTKSCTSRKIDCRIRSTKWSPIRWYDSRSCLSKSDSKRVNVSPPSHPPICQVLQSLQKKTFIQNVFQNEGRILLLWVQTSS